MVYTKRKRMSKRYRPRRYRKVYRKRGRRANLKRLIRKQIMKNAETKFYSYQYENNQLFHDVTSTVVFDPYSFVVKGTQRNQRIGEEITSMGMKLKLWIANKLDRPNVMYRLVVGLFPRQINGSLITAANAPTFLYQQADAGNGANPLLLQKNNDNGVKWLYDKVLRLEKGTSGTAAGVNRECHMLKRLWISFKNRTLKYAGAVAPQGYVPIVFLEAYDSYGTLISDNIASYAYQVYVYYKDS